MGRIGQRYFNNVVPTVLVIIRPIDDSFVARRGACTKLRELMLCIPTRSGHPRCLPHELANLVYSIVFQVASQVFHLRHPVASLLSVDPRSPPVSVPSCTVASVPLWCCAASQSRVGLTPPPPPTPSTSPHSPAAPLSLPATNPASVPPPRRLARRPVAASRRPGPRPAHPTRS